MIYNISGDSRASSAGTIRVCIRVAAWVAKEHDKVSLKMTSSGLKALNDW